MLNQFENEYILLLPEKQIHEFINGRENTLKIINAMEPQLVKHFPNNIFSIEICDKLGWTTETKLLINVHVDEEMFFNGMLDHFNQIYDEIGPIIEDMENTVVLFPKISNRNFDKLRIQVP